MMFIFKFFVHEFFDNTKSAWVDLLQFSASVAISFLSMLSFYLLGKLSNITTLENLILQIVCLQILLMPFMKAIFSFLWAFREGQILQHLLRPWHFFFLVFFRWLKFRMACLAILFSGFLIFMIAQKTGESFFILWCLNLLVGFWVLLFTGCFALLTLFLEKHPPIDYILSLFWRFALVPAHNHPPGVRMFIALVPSCYGAWFVLNARDEMAFLRVIIVMLVTWIAFFLLTIGTKKRLGEYAN